MPDKSDATEARSNTSVFISYSRKDSAFAQELRDALEQRGFAAYLDTKDIQPGEYWRARLEGLILAADAVVFIISPNSVARWDLPPPDKSVCAWEIRRIVELKKQLVPVVWQALANSTIPSELGKPNWVSFEAYERSVSTDEVAFAAADVNLATCSFPGTATFQNVRETSWPRVTAVRRPHAPHRSRRITDGAPRSPPSLGTKDGGDRTPRVGLRRSYRGILRPQKRPRRLASAK